MDGWIQDARYGMRALRQRPLFAAVAVLSLSIGIGATTSIFSLIDAILLEAPRGIVDPDRVVDIGRTNGGRGFDTFSYPELLDMREQVTPLAAVSGFRIVPLSFSVRGAEAQRASGYVVSHTYFEVMGIRPQVGRFFTEEEDRTPGTHAVAVVTDRFWRDRLGADPGVVGRGITLNRREFTVVGVAPAGFDGHIAPVRADVFIPMMMMGVATPGFSDFGERRSVWLTALGRLAPGATVEQANAALTATFERLRSVDEAAYRNRSARAMTLGPIPGGGRGPATAFLGLILALVGLVLMITCANVAGMLVARAAAREREIAIRLALGSGRARLVRQLLVESVLLFLLGGTAGLLLASWGTDLFSSVQLPAPIAVELNLRPDAGVLGAGMTLALVTGLLFGLAPALQSTRPGLTRALKNEAAAGGSRSGRMRRIFVMAQVGLSLVLLLSAGLFLRALQRAASMETGFDGRDVRAISFDLAIDGYDEARGRVFIMTLLERARAVPGVDAASVALDLPMDLSAHESPVYTEGWDTQARPFGIGSHFNRVGDAYFETLRIPVVRGRGFNGEDAPESTPVAVVSRALAETAWPGEEPLGKRLRFQSSGGTLLTVVGVVTDVKDQSLMEPREPMIYLPVSQNYEPGLMLLVRTAAPSADAAAAIRGAVQAVDPDLSLTPVLSVEEITRLGLLPQRLAAAVTTGLGFVALLLSAIGVYGIVAFTVSQKTREIGIRMALGARRSDVVSLLLRGGLRLAVPGLMLGLAAGVALSRVIRSFTLGVGTADPLTFTLVPLVLLAVVFLASWSPARRASSIEPAAALRTD